MANKKISELTPKAAQLQDDDLLMVSDYNGATYDTKSITGANIRPYTTVMFNISQTSTSAPTKNYSYETEVSQTFTLARLATGAYTLTASSALFTSSKTYVSITLGSGPNGTCVRAERSTSTVIDFGTSDGATGNFIDSALTNATLEIKIIK
jgi:hypothetical protein